MFGNPSEDPWTKFITIMKGKYHIPPSIPR